jgi:death-on-curing protein
MDWERVAQAAVLAIHDEQIAEHGGAAGVRDLGLLELALAQPQHLATYDPEADAAGLAAAYAFGTARNHPFVDGNKRTALVVLELFLEINGQSLTADDADCVATMLALAAGELSEDALAEWVRDRSGPVHG